MAMNERPWCYHFLGETGGGYTGVSNSIPDSEFVHSKHDGDGWFMSWPIVFYPENADLPTKRTEIPIFLNPSR